MANMSDKQSKSYHLCVASLCVYPYSRLQKGEKQ